MEQKHNPNEPLQDPAIVGDVLNEFFAMDPAVVDAAIDERRTQVRGKLVEHHAQSVRDGLDAQSKDEIEEGDDTIQEHRKELWRLDAEDKGLHTDE